MSTSSLALRLAKDSTIQQSTVCMPIETPITSTRQRSSRAQTRLTDCAPQSQLLQVPQWESANRSSLQTVRTQKQFQFDSMQMSLWRNRLPQMQLLPPTKKRLPTRMRSGYAIEVEHWLSKQNSLHRRPRHRKQSGVQPINPLPSMGHQSAFCARLLEALCEQAREDAFADHA